MSYSYIDLGSWGPAYRDEIDGIPIARYKNAAGQDWYETWAHNPDAPAGLVIFLNEEGVVESVCNHVDQSDPGNKRGLVLPDFPADSQVRRAVLGKVFDLATGTFIAAPVKVPLYVTRGQALMALYKSGLFPSVRATVAAHPLEEVRIWFDNALNWERENPYVLAIGVELGLTPTQIDDLFLAASLEGA